MFSEDLPISKFDLEAVQRFVRDRQIKHEDFPLIEALLTVPKTIIIDFHNFFQSNKERSVRVLQNEIQRCEDGDSKKLCILLLELVQKYDWTTGWNIITVLEKI